MLEIHLDCPYAVTVPETVIVFTVRPDIVAVPDLLVYASTHALAVTEVDVYAVTDTLADVPIVTSPVIVWYVVATCVDDAEPVDEVEATTVVPLDDDDVIFVDAEALIYSV